jgi:hypothetical protein
LQSYSQAFGARNIRHNLQKAAMNKKTVVGNSGRWVKVVIAFEERDLL